MVPLETYRLSNTAQMAPHSMDTILRPPQWPVALSNFVTWCLMWDPRSRPTSAQAMNHEYFADAVDPLRPKSSTTRLLGRKHASIEAKSNSESVDRPSLSSKSSWFRKSIIRDTGPAVPQSNAKTPSESPHSPPVHAGLVHANTSSNINVATTTSTRPFASKRATWTNGVTPSIGAPMPILPSIRPISPISDAVTAQAHSRLAANGASASPNASSVADSKSSKKIGRQLSVASNGNHYADYHRQEAERALNGNRDSMSPSGYQKESFFSHLRKRARRLSGRPQAPLSPNSDDVEANAGCGPWQSNRSSMIVDAAMLDSAVKKNASDNDRSFPNARLVDASPSPSASQVQKGNHTQPPHVLSSNSERHQTLSQGQPSRSVDTTNAAGASAGSGPISSRTRRALHMSPQPAQMYETPDEEDELLHDALSAQKVTKGQDQRKRAEDDSYRTLVSKEKARQPLQQSAINQVSLNPYPTPSPSAKRDGILFSQNLMEKPITPLNISKVRRKEDVHPEWPTPPYEENEWAASAAASIFAAGLVYE